MIITCIYEAVQVALRFANILEDGEQIFEVYVSQYAEQLEHLLVHRRVVLYGGDLHIFESGFLDNKNSRIFPECRMDAYERGREREQIRKIRKQFELAFSKALSKALSNAPYLQSEDVDDFQKQIDRIVRGQIGHRVDLVSLLILHGRLVDVQQSTQIGLLHEAVELAVVQVCGQTTEHQVQIWQIVDVEILFVLEAAVHDGILEFVRRLATGRTATAVQSTAQSNAAPQTGSQEFLM